MQVSVHVANRRRCGRFWYQVFHPRQRWQNCRLTHCVSSAGLCLGVHLAILAVGACVRRTASNQMKRPPHTTHSNNYRNSFNDTVSYALRFFRSRLRLRDDELDDELPLLLELPELLLLPALDELELLLDELEDRLRVGRLLARSRLSSRGAGRRSVVSRGPSRGRRASSRLPRPSSRPARSESTRRGSRGAGSRSKYDFMPLEPGAGKAADVFHDRLDAPASASTAPTDSAAAASVCFAFDSIATVSSFRFAARRSLISSSVNLHEANSKQHGHQTAAHYQ